MLHWLSVAALNRLLCALQVGKLLGPRASVVLSIVLVVHLFGSSTAYLLIIADCLVPLVQQASWFHRAGVHARASFGWAQQHAHPCFVLRTVRAAGIWSRLVGAAQRGNQRHRHWIYPPTLLSHFPRRHLRCDSLPTRGLQNCCVMPAD